MAIESNGVVDWTNDVPHCRTMIKSRVGGLEVLVWRLCNTVSDKECTWNFSLVEISYYLINCYSVLKQENASKAVPSSSTATQVMLTGQGYIWLVNELPTVKRGSMCLNLARRRRCRPRRVMGRRVGKGIIPSWSVGNFRR